MDVLLVPGLMTIFDGFSKSFGDPQGCSLANDSDWVGAITFT